MRCRHHARWAFYAAVEAGTTTNVHWRVGRLFSQARVGRGRRGGNVLGDQTVAGAGTGAFVAEASRLASAPVPSGP